MMKTLVVGLEGLSPELTFRWAQEGALPTLKQFIERGTRGKLESVPNLDLVSAWVSFAFGLEPGRHGVFSLRDLTLRSLYGDTADVNDWHGEAFWDRLVNLGYSVGLINVPLADLGGVTAEEVNISGCWDQGFFYRLEMEVSRMVSRGQWDRAARAVTESLEAQRELVMRFLKKNSPDFLVIVFTAAEIAQRFFWRFFDPKACGIKLPENSELVPLIKKVYCRLDTVLSEVIEMTSPETVAVISSRGYGVNQRGAECLPGWLENVGLLRTRVQRGDLWCRLIGGRTAGTNFGGWRPMLKSEAVLKDLDWSRTKAYSVGTDEIYINLEGREPGGIVPESHYEDLCETIVDLLKQTVDPVTKESVVSHVVLGRDVYDGPFVYRAPDVLIRWRGERMLNGLEIPGCKPVYARGSPIITGSSRQYGIFLAVGSGIRKGFEITSARITDLSATFLHLLGEEVPTYMEGHVMTHIFDVEWLALHPVMIEEGVVRQSGRREIPKRDSDDEMRLVEERLRGLGYID
jgi:predicted AlkP superfamily phosphohydrolase/phosphomutase